MAESPIDRRRFFREGLRKLLKPVVSAMEPVERVAQQLGNMEAQGEAAKEQKPVVEARPTPAGVQPRRRQA